MGLSVTTTALSFGVLMVGWLIRGRVVLELGPPTSDLPSTLDLRPVVSVSAGQAKKLVLEIINELSTRLYQQNFVDFQGRLLDRD